MKEIPIDGELGISKKGGYYVYLTPEVKETKTTEYNYFNVTKSQIELIGTIKEWEKTNRNVIVYLTANNKLLIKDNTKMFKPLGKNILVNFYSHGSDVILHKLAKLYLYNKKAEWLKHNLEFIRLRCALQFSSLKDFKLC